MFTKVKTNRLYIFLKLHWINDRFHGYKVLWEEKCTNYFWCSIHLYLCTIFDIAHIHKIIKIFLPFLPTYGWNESWSFSDNMIFQIIVSVKKGTTKNLEVRDFFKTFIGFETRFIEPLKPLNSFMTLVNSMFAAGWCTTVF